MNILCVGFYDNGLSLLLKLLFKRKKFGYTIESAGINNHAHNELPLSKTVVNIAKELGFIITSQNPSHHAIHENAKKEGRFVFHHIPTHISRVRDLRFFGPIVTPYCMVRDQLIERHGVDEKKILLICDPCGISLRTDVQKAFSIMQEWTEEQRL